MGKYLLSAVFILVLFIPLASAATLSGSSSTEKANDAWSQIKAASSGQEIKDIIIEVDKDTQVEAEFLSILTSKLKASGLGYMIPAGWVDVIFVTPSGGRVDMTFTLAPDKKFRDLGTSSNPSWTYQIVVDETLLSQIKGNPAAPTILANAVSSGRVKLVARAFLNKYKTVFIVFSAKLVSVFKPAPRAQQILNQAQSAAQQAPSLMCPIFCSYTGPAGNNAGTAIPDCEIKDFDACTGQAYTGFKYESCGCQKQPPSKVACPDTCKLDGARSCWVDRTLVGKSNVVCAGHVFGVGNLAPYQKAPDQPACICS